MGVGPSVRSVSRAVAVGLGDARGRRKDGESRHYLSEHVSPFRFHRPPKTPSGGEALQSRVVTKAVFHLWDRPEGGVRIPTMPIRRKRGTGGDRRLLGVIGSGGGRRRAHSSKKNGAANGPPRLLLRLQEIQDFHQPQIVPVTPESNTVGASVHEAVAAELGMRRAAGSAFFETVAMLLRQATRARLQRLQFVHVVDAF